MWTQQSKQTHENLSEKKYPKHFLNVKQILSLLKEGDFIRIQKENTNLVQASCSSHQVSRKGEYGREGKHSIHWAKHTQ